MNRQNFTLTLVIENYPSNRTPLVLSFIYYEQAFNSADKRVLAKFLSFYSKPDNNNAADKVGNGISSWFCIKSGVQQGYVLSPFVWIILIEFVLRSTAMAMGEHEINSCIQTLLKYDWAEDLRILNENVSKMNEVL